MSRRRKEARTSRPNPDTPPRFGATDTRDRLATAGVCVALALAVAAVFGQTVGFDFVNIDDAHYVSENLMLTRGLNAETVAWAWTNNRGNLWIPLTWMSYLLDYQLCGRAPWGYHLTNVLLHAATSILLFLVLRRMTGRFWPSAFVAAIFAIHPLRAESVAWVTERKDTLAGLFFVLALWAYAGYVQRPFSWRRYATVVILFALGLLAKPTAVTLPFLLLLLDYWPLERFSMPGGHAGLLSKNKIPCGEDAGSQWTRILSIVFEKIPLLVVAIGVSAITVAVQGDIAMSLEEATPFWRVGNAAVSYITYLSQFFRPVNMAIPYPREFDLPVWKMIVAAAVLLGVTAAAVWMRVRRPYFLVGWLWYLGMLVPNIGIVQIGVNLAADRFTYLPQIGVAIVVVWGAAEFIAARPAYRGWCLAAAAVALAGLMVAAWCQTAVWRDSETLWNHSLACLPNGGVAHGSLGAALLVQERWPEAADHLRKALKIDPNDATVLCNLGTAAARLGLFDEAVDCFRKAAKIKPKEVSAYYNLGIAMDDSGRGDEAMKNFRKAVDVDPGNFWAQTNLGIALAKRGRFDEAAECFQKAATLDPGDAKARLNWADALATLKRFEEAKTQYRAAAAAARWQGQEQLAKIAEARLRALVAARSKN